MDSAGLARFMTLPVEIVLCIADQLDDWWDIHNLMRAYLGYKDKYGNTTRLFQKIMFRTDARNLKTLAYWNAIDEDRGLVQKNPPILACSWAILMGDVEVALSAMPEYRAQDNECHLHWPGSWRGVLVNLSPSGPQKSTTIIDDPTPVMLAVLSGKISMLKAILDQFLPTKHEQQTWGPICLNDSRRAVDSTRSVHFEVTALDLAAQQGRTDLVKLLIDQGAEVGWSHQDRESRDETKTSVLAALCDWGLDLYVSEEQQAGRVAVLEFLLDQGHEVNQANHCDYVRGSKDGRFLDGNANVIPYPFMPLSYTIRAMKRQHLALAQSLLRHGARWAPWTDPGKESWARHSIYNANCMGTYRMSPLEWVLLGAGYEVDENDLGNGERLEEAWTDVEELEGEELTADDTIDEDEVGDKGDGMAYKLQQPNEEKLQVEEALFRTMMEEGINTPIKPSHLRWVLETVLQGYSVRASNRHPRLMIHFVKMVNYLTERGATFEGLHKKSVKILAELARRSRKLVENAETLIAISKTAEES
ncbi:hypothetical protein B0I37DRAFT_349986 [Chaetomium sp. MPI-CAGE-AT-0009]|nr:hypothetical protein B0I37DRAFT_349986 [Chaetomium sp. MPI-CAGE-AT-0009]